LIREKERKKERKKELKDRVTNYPIISE